LDGNLVVTGAGTYGSGCIYSVGSNAYSQIMGPAGPNVGATISSDGNIIGSGIVLDDASGTDVGRLAHPTVFYGSNLNQYAEDQVPANALYNPRLNDSGSLYFWPFPNYFEIIDVPTGRLRLRFSLTEKVQNAVAPLALDDGHNVFLITDKGLTIVDLGSAPLSVGHLTPSVVSAGTQVQIRGSGFESGITADIGGEPATVKFTDENTLTISVPALSSGLKDLTVTNPDGSTYVLQSAIKVP
jgi:IPT/TIG domain